MPQSGTSCELLVIWQLENHIQEFRKCQDVLAEVKEKYSQGSGGVTTLARELAHVSEDLEAVKAEMDQRGTSMTDAAPLVKIKQALTKLKAESTQMEVRLGVVSGMWTSLSRGCATAH